MAKGKPYLQNGVRHECITPVTTLDMEAGIRKLADYRSKARYVPDGEPGGYRAAEHVLKNVSVTIASPAPSWTATRTPSR